MTAVSGSRMFGAMVLAAIAAVLFWIGWSLQLLPRSFEFSIIGAMAIAAPMLLVMGRQQPAFLTLASFLLVAYPLAAILFDLMAYESAAEIFASWRIWPLLLLTCASALAVSLLEEQQVKTAFGAGLFAFLALGGLGVLAGEAGLIDRWAMRSPVHLLIVLVAVITFVAQGLAIARGGYGESDGRFVSGMIQLLPLLGFAGTILGIMDALTALPELFDEGTETDSSSTALRALLSGLAGAFETTLLGLFGSIAASFLNTFVRDPEA